MQSYARRIALLAGSAFFVCMLVSKSRRAQKEEVVPYPDAMTGKEAPAFSMQGAYGEIYSPREIKNSPAIFIFGTSW